jgi:hypothetical protein
LSSRLGAPARLIWSLAGSGLGTTIATGSGNSGAWPTPPYQPTQQNNMTPVDLRDVEDLWLTVMATGLTGTPSLAVQFNAFDDGGNAWPLLTAPLTVTAVGVAAGKQFPFGKHGASAGNFYVFPAWGQVAWTLTGAASSFTGVDISLWAR